MYLKSQNSFLAALYMRLSKDDGDKVESDSIRNQRSLLRDFVKQHSDITLVKEYVDDGFSGTNFERPDFQRMLEDARNHKINCIIVKDLSRLGRNYIETGRYLEKIFPVLGIRFIAVNDHYDSADTTNDSDQIIVPFKNLVNDAYCRDISIKIRSQLDIKRKKGQFIGNYAGYGYFKDPKDKNHLVIDEYAAEIVRMIFNMKIDGYSAKNIAARLNEMGVLIPAEYKRACGFNYSSGFMAGKKPKWDVSSVLRILKNELYTGTMVQGKTRKINYKVNVRQKIEPENWIRVEGTHEPIVSKEIFECVQKLMELDTRTSPEEESIYEFSGLLRCGDCGQNLVRRTTTKKGKKYFYYHCSTYKRKEGCSSHNISDIKLRKAVLEAIRSQVALIVKADEIIAQIENLPQQQFGVKILDTQMKTLHKEIQKYEELKVKCGNCGLKMMYNYGAMPVVYCGHTAAVGSMSTCDKTRYSAAKIERIVLVALRKQLEIFQSMAKILEEGEEKNKTNLPAMQRNMEQELEKLKAERIRQYEAYAEGVVSQETYLKNKKDLNEKIEIIQDKYEQIQEVTSVEDDLMKDIRIVEKNAEEVNILKKMTRHIAETFVEEITIYDSEKIEIRFVFDDLLIGMADRIKKKTEDIA